MKKLIDLHKTPVNSRLTGLKSDGSRVTDRDHEINLLQGGEGEAIDTILDERDAYKDFLIDFVEYLDNNHPNVISSGSELHREAKELLE